MSNKPHPFDSGEIIDVYLRNAEGWSYHGCTRAVRKNFGETSRCVFVHERTGHRYRRDGSQILEGASK